LDPFPVRPAAMFCHCGDSSERPKFVRAQLEPASARNIAAATVYPRRNSLRADTVTGGSALLIYRLSLSPTQPQYMRRRHCKAHIRGRVMCSLQPFISSPVHAFRFGRECVENGWIAVKQLMGPTERRPVVWACQLVPLKLLADPS
jgi:hypothetical protein